MMKSSLEDLSARARRHELSSTDARKLGELLAGAPEERLWHEAGLQFDAEDRVLPGDHAASERVIARLLGEIPVKKPPSRARWAVLLIAATLLLASAAGAAVLGMRHFGARPRPSAAPARASAALAPAAAPTPPTLPNADGPNTTERRIIEPDTTQPDLGKPSRVTSAQPKSPPPASEPSTPAELFSAAGQARRQGYSSQAVQLLESLQARFPGSAEARTSEITLGMLQLKAGAAGSALGHFDRYLKRAPSGELASEALWGRAQALFGLGREAEARAALTSLLDRYPGSSYASAARAKLRHPTPAL